MSDLSLWEADEPGVSPEWWGARRRHIPMRARKEFDRFHDVLWIYRNQQTEEHLHDVKLAVHSLIAAITEVSDVRLKVVRIQIGVAHRYPNLITALQNFLGILQPHVVPEAYRDML